MIVDYDYVELAAASFGCSKAELLSFKEHPDSVVVILPSGQKKTVEKSYLLAFDGVKPAAEGAAELPAVKPAAEPKVQAEPKAKPAARRRKAAK